ncbi:hypothetical protein Aperf_G00000001795 [Anoplocephala perfoliata]
MQSSSGESVSSSDFLLVLPKESLVSIIRQMSTEMSQLRSQITMLERRNTMLQDRLPELIQNTIQSALNSRTNLDNRQGSIESKNGTITPASIDTGDPVIAPVGLLPLSTSLHSASTTPSTSMNSEPIAVMKLLTSFLQSTPAFTPVGPTSSSSSLQLPISVAHINGKPQATETSDLMKLPPLPPLSSQEDENDLDGGDGKGCGLDNPPSKAVKMPRSVNNRSRRTTRSRTETTSLLSDEMIAQIEDQIHASMTERRERYWQIFLESKGWTRATCALMSCLFTRTQMAHSTVYGRPSPVGGEARDRLPTRLVHYIITKINNRFGVNPVKVRARMAQKCKDLRRLLRKYGDDNLAAEDAATPPINYNLISITGSGDMSSPSPPQLDIETASSGVSLVVLPPLSDIVFPPTS